MAQDDIDDRKLNDDNYDLPEEDDDDTNRNREGYTESDEDLE